MSKHPKNLPSTAFFHDPAQLLHSREGRDGRIEVNTSAISWVGIADITQVKEHRICEVMGTVSHVVYFHNGAHLSYTYGFDGGPIQLHGNGVDIHHAGNGMVMVTPSFELMGAAPDEGGWAPFPNAEHRRG